MPLSRMRRWLFGEKDRSSVREAPEPEQREVRSDDTDSDWDESDDVLRPFE